MKYVTGVLIFLVLCASMILLLSELSWLLLLVAIPIWFSKSGFTKSSRVALLICAITGVFHYCGYKIYGSPELAEPEVLANPVILTGIEPPNIMRLADGRSVPLADVSFPQAIDFTKDPIDTHSQTAAIIFNRWDRLSPVGKGIPVELQAVQTGTHAVLMRRVYYWCGNTWFPRFFPKASQRQCHVIVEKI
jgi:hypothetical protein